MAVSISIPTALRSFAGGNAEVAVAGRSVHEVLTGLVSCYPDMRRHLYAETGELRGFVGIYLNDENVRDLHGPATTLSDGDTLMILPSIAGG